MPRLPQVAGSRLMIALSKKGWYADRIRGSHAVLRNQGKPGIIVVVPVHTKPLKPGTLRNIMRRTELSVEELLELL